MWTSRTQLRSALLIGLTCVGSVSSFAFAQPPGGRRGPSGQGPGPARFIEVDAERDLNLKTLRSALALSSEQDDGVTRLYKQLRADQFQIVQSQMRDAIANRSNTSERPSPEMRAKQEAVLSSKISPVNTKFLDDLRAKLNAEQLTKFESMAEELDLYPIRGEAQAAAINTPFSLKNRIRMEEKDGFRILTSNGIPDYTPGIFPGRGNPSAIQEQNYTFRIPLKPQVNDRPSPHRGLLAGVALNGVVFDPGTAEMWRNDPQSGWRQEAISPLTISGAKMGLDRSNAHVQPSGAYHYHAMPTTLVRKLAEAKNVKVGQAMIQIGWSADGFPIYDNHGYSNAKDASSPIKELHSSYRLKSGNRPGENATPPGPGGSFDGTYQQDYEFVNGSGDLDECNGRFGVTPEFPDGTYYYVVTGEYPFISRSFRGTADRSFAKNDGPGPGGRPGPGGGARPGGPGQPRPGQRPPGPNGPANS
jgi:hypothetical protein